MVRIALVERQMRNAAQENDENASAHETAQYRVLGGVTYIVSSTLRWPQSGYAEMQI